MIPLKQISQKLLFVVGKGGVGRTTVSASLASYFAKQGEKVLVVQWSLKDSISPLYSMSPCHHKETAVPGGFKVMNYSASDAIREYFVDHLKMKLIYAMVIENRHVQRLIHAAPGVQELFFLGRLFWLVELAQQEKGYHYDRVIVDSPATGHGISLFGIAPAVANLGMTGPLAAECERVTKLLMNKEKTGFFVVTLPEELPIEECFESIPKLTAQMQRPPLAVIVNQSNNAQFFPELSRAEHEEWFLNLKSSLTQQESKQEIDLILSMLNKRNLYENKLTQWVNDFTAKTNQQLPIMSLPDVELLQKIESPLQIIEALSNYFSSIS
ncbi:ArsA family ATPase [Silvanigrella aquatica]|uniref:arsenite-transporting ATPase n=1 Tax=Silvanigrella aquatica TaxID=1915309 RepID=A0A1L4D231_9BACT|nr:ArsA family ATPase [Silvanigrella aquatica]APJ04263.1 hypothetical protein AXG55_10235 [Silvanigrella aquatica]